MYYKKNRSILASIRNNKNNKVYYILVVVMLAAIGLIAASIILKGYNSGDSKVTETTAVATETEQNAGPSEADNISVAQGYRIYIFVEEGMLAYCSINSAGEVIDIAGAALCNIGSGVKEYLDGNNQVVLKDTLSASGKMLWKEFNYDETEYYVQYYSLINGIEFHSALYLENGDYYSIVKDSYDSINKYIRNNDVTGSIMDCRGITLSVSSAKEIYENVPATADIVICKSFSESELYNKQLLGGKAYDDLYAVVNSTMDSEYITAGKLPDIAEGYNCDPTDSEANYVFSPYRLGAINNVTDKTAEFGQIVYSIINEETGSTLIKELFSDVVLMDDSGQDISKYLMVSVDLSAYNDAQIAGMNVNGFLIPGDYLIKFYATDTYGTYLEKKCYFHVTDTTPPSIVLSREITEINQEQIDNPDYIKGMVTVTELCKLSDQGLTYELTEENGRVRIHFSASDVYGNTGVLELELQKVE